MSLADRLKDIDVTQLRLKNGMTMEQILRQEAERLRQCIQDRIDEIYDIYQPRVYQRTYAFQSSLYVDDVVRIDTIGKKLTIRLLFNDNAYHPSLWGGDKGYLPSLLNDGWSWKNSNIDIYRFSNFDGYHFLENAVDDYNQDNPYGIKVNIIKNAT